MPKKVTIDAYEITELEGRAKEHAMDKLREWESETANETFQEDLNSYWKDKLEKQGFNEVEFQYSLGYSQGDGVSFTSTLDVKQFLKAHKLQKEFPIIWKYYEEIYVDAWIKRTGHHYVHSNTVDAIVEVTSCDLPDTICEQIDKEADDLEKVIGETKDDLCREIEENGYEHFEYFDSEENIIETAEANDWLFDKSGRLI